MIAKQDAGILIDEIRRKRGVSWQSLADSIHRPVVWTTAAILGMHPLTETEAEVVGHTLSLDDDLIDALTRQPNRALAIEPSTDPTIYRLHELVQVYGMGLKALIHEEFGDGIMSAINCSVTLDRVPHEDGDRVRIVIDGKFLPYAWVDTAA